MLQHLPDSECEQLVKNLVIPPRPEILVAIREAQLAEEPDFPYIASLINSDLALSMAMLKTVNSPFFQLTQKITSIDQAMQLLGLRNICNLLEGQLLRQTLSGEIAAEHEARMSYFWETSVQIAMISAQIASNVHGISAEEAYTFGLFRNSGKAIMAARFDTYMDTMTQGERMSRQEYIALENTRHQSSHHVVGYLLSRTWYLPESMQLAILNHNDLKLFEQAMHGDWHHICTLIAIASLAEHILKMHVHQFEHPEWRRIEPLLLNHLALKLEEFEDMVDKVSLF
ncbi:HDOD domain-containing protein [Chitinibacter sp. GC72]|uniref:HDOD domain-containing protein n=1 Tax=Chitinibacter sp. GC72 TaxID=1526917 RepID=UPI0012FBC497|nr:HDOD domain-containing protein [Chitinibacter sp. GC72]